MRGACSTSATLINFAASVYLSFFSQASQHRFSRLSLAELVHRARTKARADILKSSSRDRGLWGALLVLSLLATQPAQARPRHSEAHHSDAWAREHFAAAERMREALNGRPPGDRTRHDYQRVVNSYRAIYLGAPASTKADPSVVAVAETLVEMGRRFEDNKILNKAIEQYKFLRREYPGSKDRADGLFTVAEIYKDDLNDSASARASFEDFLRHYPHNRLADDARQAILEIDQQTLAETEGKTRLAPERVRVARNASDSNNNEVKAGGENRAARASALVAIPQGESPQRSHSLPRVTGIRHWSTPDYTRVAIDVESEVNFSSQRIATPARIFFDLNGTKLASTLVGKSFDVEDGFLKKVRMAQFAPGRTRVVLEVDNLSEYDAFLLPNPYRLIIDIHGKDIHGKDIYGKNLRARQRKDAGESSSSEAQSGLVPPIDGEIDSSETKVALPTPSGSETATDSDAEVKNAVVTRAEVASIYKRPHTPVVKKIVDADDNDDDENVETSESESAKQSVQSGKRSLITAQNAGVPKKIVDNDLSDESATLDSSPVRRGRSDSTGSRHRTTTRSLASSGSRSVSDLDIREARPTASGDRSLIRALGLKIGKIVIDPGHGGHDTGTIGPNGLEEKDLVLEVSRRLGKLLESRLGAEVVYTRKDDTFIPLETRTAIANQARADLFVSIHANSSHDPDARGVETYYLNFTSSPEALEVAARENAVSSTSIYELQDLVKKIALKEKIDESREFAGDVQQSLHSGLAVKSPAIRDRGVKKAPFIVLIGANMPSILAEISFVSNPTDEHRLATSEYRERIAESLYRGIAKYVNGLSGVKVASKMDKAGGQ
jgi:N-acetylmuramoyl-L-alanine amidase